MKFAINWDYRCPFARNAHEHLAAALQGGADWDVEFIPFSLSQSHIEEGELSVWDDPSLATELLAVAAGMVVNERHPEVFLDVHVDLFAARHDDAKDIREWSVIAEVLTRHGIDAATILEEIEQGDVLKRFRDAHERTVSELAVFGVPTFFVDDSATFVRVMTRPRGDRPLARDTIERILSIAGDHPEFNEIKRTTIPR